MTQITRAEVFDVRFPTSLELDGSDAMHVDADYSAAYVVLHTDSDICGYGMTFTIGRGNELCVSAAERIAERLIGWDIEDMVDDMGPIYRHAKSDHQLRWLGPDKGVVHLALAAVMNAVWDLVARLENLPVWELLATMTPAQLVRASDFTYITDAITPAEALELLEKQVPTREFRIRQLQSSGYPCYTTSPGWLGYSDEKMLASAQRAVDASFQHIKLKVGANLQDDRRRCALVRDLIGPARHLMIDANQMWDVDQAIEWTNSLAEFNPLWVEEPTAPDDALGHATIRRAVAPVGVATGEHAHNRVLFKQLFQARAIDFAQIDACRLGGINEILPVLFMAAKFGVPVCPHAGGVGLCELVQHLSFFDFIAVSGTREDRVIEYVEHLHEHFTDPVNIVNASYRPTGQPGYSARMKPRSVQTYSYPDGTYWISQLKGAAVGV